MFQKIKTLLTATPEHFSGLHPDKPDARDYVRAAKAAPKLHVFSLQNQGRKRALDQKQTSACTGYSASAFMSCLHGAFNAGARWEASPMFIYYKSRQIFGALNFDAGAPLRDTMKALHQFGVCPMSAHPDLYDWEKPPTAEADALASLLRVKDYQRILVDEQAPDIMMQTLYNERLPILIGVRLFTGADSFKTRFTGDIKLPGNQEAVTGSHAMMIDGYDMDAQKFYGWNSWGTGWGSGGRFSLPFEYFTSSELCFDIWTVSYRYWGDV